MVAFTKCSVHRCRCQPWSPVAVHPVPAVLGLGLCTGQRLSVTFLRRPPPPPPLLNRGFPARLAGAGALVFRGEGGRRRWQEGPCSGGFRTLSAQQRMGCLAA